jgi:molecular chaperone DnaK (HSP70)
MTPAAGGASSRLRAFYTVVSGRLGPDLFSAIEAAKMRLSEVEETEIRFETEGVRIVQPLSRADLRALFQDQLQAIRELIHGVLQGAGKEPGEVDRVLLAGGSSALVCTQELLRDVFGADRVPLRQDLFTSIVRGLALDAASV